MALIYFKTSQCKFLSVETAQKCILLRDLVVTLVCETGGMKLETATHHLETATSQIWVLCVM